MPEHKEYMYRCFQLAFEGAGNVAPNPMVGAVLVHNHRIIGEGFHQQYGQAHAEVNCINSVAEEDKELIQDATLYVSLEPCSHFGKTPPCADLIIENRIPQVVIGCRDAFAKVNGKGIEKLIKAGIEVIEGVEEAAAIELNKRFFSFHQNKRPYIILKWAQTKNNIVASSGSQRLLISNAITNRLVHRWRSEEAAIMIGAVTALKDDPLLDNRNWFGKPPVKLIVGTATALPEKLKLFQSGADTIVFNSNRNNMQQGRQFIKLEKEGFLKQMMDEIYKLNLQSVLVEGGPTLLQSLIDAGLWNEARIITNTTMIAADGLEAPKLANHQLIKREQILTDEIAFYKNNANRL